MVGACGLIAVLLGAEARPGVCYLNPGADFAAEPGSSAAPSVLAGRHPDQSADEVQVREALRRYDAAVLAMNADAIAAFYLPDGEMWDNGKLVRKGPEAVRAFLKTFDGQVRVESQQTTIDRISWQGSRAIVETSYQQQDRVLATNAVIKVHGHIRFEWVRDEAGHWRVARAETKAD